jgi:putative hydrolase of the HAD superfamily
MIQAIIFDLDNTLYSSKYGLEKNVASRIRTFIAAYLNLDEAEAAAERRKTFARYGTTLEWLVGEKGFTAVEDYFAAIHPEGEEAGLPPDPALGEFLRALPVKKGILTNSPREHADRILKKLGIADLFDQIVDMRANNLQGKPRPEAFYRILKGFGISPEVGLFIDDFPSYVVGYRDLGGPGLLFDEFDTHTDFPGPRIGELRELLQFLD